MPSTSECLEGWLTVLDGVGELKIRKMMGEYLIYVDGNYLAGIFDDSSL